MTHALDDARLKIDRAQEHLAEIRAEIARYLDTHPYEFPTERDGDVLTAKPAIIRQEPPHRLRSIVGDVLGNLRPILDYIAWQIATHHAKPPPVVGEDKGIFFPILDSPTGDAADRFEKMARKYAFPAAAVSLIHSVQPYIAGYEPLGILNALVNMDKHCLPLLTVAYADTTSIDLTVEGGSLGTCVMHPPGSKAIVMGHNVVSMSVRRLTLDDLTPDGRLKTEPFPADLVAACEAAQRSSSHQPSTIKVDGKVAVFVAIQHASVPLAPVERTLEQIVNCAQGVVATFDALV